MIKINITAVGKVKEDYFLRGIEEYKKRITKYAEINFTEVKEELFYGEPQKSEISDILLSEGRRILKSAGTDFTALTIEGAQLSSEGFACFLKERIDRGKELNFVIGGSYGLSDEVKSAAKSQISFSKMTFPHTMARLILTEQLYRALTIINGAAYHK